MRWKILNEQFDAEKIAAKCNISKITATVLLNRNIHSIDEIEKYIKTSSKNFCDTSKIKDFTKAMEILKKSIENNEKIYIYGDYDVDGIMSTTILYKGLKNLSADVHFYVPHRVNDGYGLNSGAVQLIADADCKLLITCDNGISSINEIALAKELGLTVIILDHHEPILENGIQRLPDCDAVVDCKRLDSEFAFRDMCAGGLCYRFIKSFYTYINKHFLLDRELVTFAGIATVCDIVSLQSDNRIMVKLALYMLNNDIRNIGLKYLVAMTVPNGKNINTYSIGFLIGPCINAVGRLEAASEAVKLFTTDDDQTAKELAERLVQKNKERQEITVKATENLINQVDTSLPIQILYDPTVHESVAGIIASRIKEKFYRPTLVITNAENGCKGSARSIDEYNLHYNMTIHGQYFTKFGGHALAAGFSLPYENIEPLRKAMNENCTLNTASLIPSITLEQHINLEKITIDIAKELELLAPFGKGNEKPHFFSLNVKLKTIRFVGNEKNIAQLTFSTNTNKVIKAIYFNGADRIKELLKEKNNKIDISMLENGNILSLSNDFKVDIAYSIEINNFNNTENIQLNIDDIR